MSKPKPRLKPRPEKRPPFATLDDGTMMSWKTLDYIANHPDVPGTLLGLPINWDAMEKAESEARREESNS